MAIDINVLEVPQIKERLEMVNTAISYGTHMSDTKTPVQLVLDKRQMVSLLQRTAERQVLAKTGFKPSENSAVNNRELLNLYQEFFKGRETEFLKADVEEIGKYTDALAQQHAQQSRNTRLGHAARLVQSLANGPQQSATPTL